MANYVVSNSPTRPAGADPIFGAANELRWIKQRLVDLKVYLDDQDLVTIVKSKEYTDTVANVTLDTAELRTVELINEITNYVNQRADAAAASADQSAESASAAIEVANLAMELNQITADLVATLELKSDSQDLLLQYNIDMEANLRYIRDEALQQSIDILAVTVNGENFTAKFPNASLSQIEFPWNLGGLSTEAPFSTEDMARVRVDLAYGGITKDLGSVA